MRTIWLMLDSIFVPLCHASVVCRCLFQSLSCIHQILLRQEEMERVGGYSSPSFRHKKQAKFRRRRCYTQDKRAEGIKGKGVQESGSCHVCSWRRIFCLCVWVCFGCASGAVKKGSSGFSPLHHFLPTSQFPNPLTHMHITHSQIPPFPYPQPIMTKDQVDLF